MENNLTTEIRIKENSELDNNFWNKMKNMVNFNLTKKIMKY